MASTGNVSILRWEERAARDWQTLVERLGRWLTPRDAGLFARYRKRLISAGFHNPSAVALFLGSKGTIGAALGLSYLVYGAMIQRALPHLLLVSAMLGGLGFFLPDVWLRFRTRQRQRAVMNALPDVLDLLMVCVEAGMGFDAAVARVAEQPGSKAGPLHQELLRMHLEVRAGRPREEAMRHDQIGARLSIAPPAGYDLSQTPRAGSDAILLPFRTSARRRKCLNPRRAIWQ